MSEEFVVPESWQDEEEVIISLVGDEALSTVEEIVEVKEELKETDFGDGKVLKTEPESEKTSFPTLPSTLSPTPIDRDNVLPKQPNQLKPKRKVDRNKCGLRKNRRNKYECNQCGKVFRAEGNLTGHLKRYHKTETHVCHWEGCTKAYKHRCDLASHISVVHEGKRVACPHCGSCFSKKSNLYNHLHRYKGCPRRLSVTETSSKHSM